ncbi:P-loop containing nucleoside triphosphate hydrolase protein [Podospora fimiseda]|uniref:P-loop containing nucleoside triphosphate hydrolase protein n=1 Tax=Podospora fimiseda TaxID=252190 RepID=A0AAN7BN08_9PEZI|nr:P-loop containing nucleoside triphosphate hydrolase protein [Podospora fimiseda]
MKLRRLCNHGSSEYFSSLGSTLTPQNVSNLVLRLETGCDVCIGSGEDRLELAVGEIYTECGNTPVLLEASDPTRTSSSSRRPKSLASNTINLVFSYWTTTLDLLQRHMQQAGISCLRIDGRVSHQERLRILEAFTTTEVPVLLMTIQTGAVGLNLTAANYVHIVEPQWNPSVEEQAIARAVRMGQTRTVTVVRYIVKSSVEENIVSIQKRK